MAAKIDSLGLNPSGSTTASPKKPEVPFYDLSADQEDKIPEEASDSDSESEQDLDSESESGSELHLRREEFDPRFVLFHFNFLVTNAPTKRSGVNNEAEEYSNLG